MIMTKKIAKKTAKKTAKKITRRIAKSYSVILEVNSKKYKAKGETLLEAIQFLKVDQVKTAGILTAQKGRLTAQRRFNRIFKLKRLFTNRILQIIVAKNLEAVMK